MFLIPYLIGNGKVFGIIPKLPGYCTIMMLCNFFNALPIAISWGSIAAQASAGGVGEAGPGSAAASAFCSSHAMRLVVGIIYSFAKAIYFVSSVAAVASWFGGARSYLVPAALAARALFNQLASLTKAAIFKEAFMTVGKGAAAPILCLALHATAALCIFSAHKISDRINGPEANARRAAAKAAKEAKLGTR